MKSKLLSLFLLLFSAIGSAQFDVTQPGNMVACSNNNFSVFNLTTQTPIILGSLSPENYTVTFHISSASANGDNAAILSPHSYSNFTNPQPIWVRIEENTNPTNYEIAEFLLIVNLNPPIANQGYSTCDVDINPGDGMTMIDLEQVSEMLWQQTGTPPDQVEMAFYISEGNAVNQVNPLSNPFEMTNPNQLIFVRSTYYATGCFTISLVTLIASDCAGECLTPQNLTASNLNGSGATFGWTTNGSETQWEVLLLNSGGPFPLPTMNGIIVYTNPISLTGLDCPESYDLYVRSVCGDDISDWSQPISFQLQNCQGGGPSEPTNLTACADNGTACFDLTVNDAEALGINPALFELTYYTSAAGAQAGTSPIANPTEYCTTVAMGADEIFIRIENIENGNFEVIWFTVTAQEIVISTIDLQTLVECDEDVNGTVIFDLTEAAAALGTTNPVAYYTDMTHAMEENDPIANPATYEISTQNIFSEIYIRETVDGGCDIIYEVNLQAINNCDISNVCAGANSLCNALGVPFTNSVGMGTAEPGNDYGCLGNAPNPTWFYLPVSGAGTINLIIIQSSEINSEFEDLDVDFVAYGPFTSPVEPCSGQLTESNIVDCSFSFNNVEYVTIPNALPGEFYIIMTSNFSNDPGYITISETGESEGEIDCSGLRLTAFIDANSNGIKDATESNFGLGQFHYERNNNSVIHNITSPSGIHRIYDANPSNSYDLSYTIDSAYTSYYGITTASYTDVSVVAGAGLQDYSFPITITQSYNDVAVTIVPTEAPRPGFTYTNTVVYTNLGGETVASGSVIFHKDADVSFVSVSEAGAVISGNNFTFNYSNLAPFEIREIVVEMQVPTIPTVQLGDLVTNTAEITPFAGDLTPENNGSVLTSTIIGSYDPNDKMESRGEQILFSDFSADDYLYYTIRFENTGTASAININVTDVLDSQLDEESVRMVSSSHNYVLDRVGSQLNWRFENVLLPPVSPGSEDGHGYITFKVKPNPGYAIGDVISNTANIYFDFNPAIVTNTFVSEFVAALAVNEFVDGDFTIYPNPADAVLNISMKESGSINALTINDVSGKVIVSKLVEAVPSATIDISDIAAGVYFIEVTSDTNSKVVKKLIIR